MAFISGSAKVTVFSTSGDFILKASTQAVWVTLAGAVPWQADISNQHRIPAISLANNRYFSAAIHTIDFFVSMIQSVGTDITNIAHSY